MGILRQLEFDCKVRSSARVLDWVRLRESEGISIVRPMVDSSPTLLPETSAQRYKFSGTDGQPTHERKRSSNVLLRASTMVSSFLSKRHRCEWTKT
jgi:hypothetical protein